MVGDMMKGAVVDAMESLMDSGAMQVYPSPNPLSRAIAPWGRAPP